MPNLESAAALIPDAPADESPAEAGDVSESTVEQSEEVASSKSEDTPTSEPSAELTPSQLRVQEMQERIARIKANRSNSKTAASIKAQQATLAAQQAEAKRIHEEATSRAKAESQRWQDALKDPINGFKALGMDPTEAYRQITDAALAEDKPERQQAKLEEKIRQELLKELAPKLSELETIKEKATRLEQAEVERQRQFAASRHNQAQSEFLKIADSPGFELLGDYFENDELISQADSIANEYSARKQTFTLMDVANELKERLAVIEERAEKRRTQREASTSAADDTALAKTKKPASSASPTQAKTVTNKMASESATTSNKSMTREERIRKAAQMLNAADRK